MVLRARPEFIEGTNGGVLISLSIFRSCWFSKHFERFFSNL